METIMLFLKHHIVHESELDIDVIQVTSTI